MNPYALLVLQVVFIGMALVIATLKSKGGPLDWLKWVAVAWGTMNVLAVLFRLSLWLVRWSGGAA